MAESGGRRRAGRGESVTGRDDGGYAVPDWPGADLDPRDVEDLELSARLAGLDGELDESGAWPEAAWAAIVAGGANRWALPAECGGEPCDRAILVRRYARLAEGSLTAAFILSQHDAAVRRLAPYAARPGVAEALRRIGAGEAFTTVGISQLTTSKRHGAAALVAAPTPGGGFRLDGVIPWVTGAERATWVVAGAATKDGKQVLLLVPTDRPGLRVEPAFRLAALQASCTAEVRCDGVEVDGDGLLAGPGEDVVAAPGMAGTGGLETSALALGQARAALKALAETLATRGEGTDALELFSEQWLALAAQLQVTAAGLMGSASAAEVRRRANALVLATTQVALTARKGSGFLRSDPAQRWARQALFFLVWSCPGPVAQAAMRDLAGLCEV
jgi:alkylation response protein AidB-like acyl-CoA dehydrogenase